MLWNVLVVVALILLALWIVGLVFSLGRAGTGKEDIIAIPAFT